MSAKDRNSEAKAWDMKGMDRRSFLRKTAVAGGATVVSATLAYGAEKSGDASLSNQGSSRDSQPGCVVNPEIPPDPIPDSSIGSTLNADVVIVGAGIAGLSAARAASEAGASVIVIEKAKTYQYRSAFYGVIDSKVHKFFNIKIDKNAAILDTLKQMSFRADQRIWKYWADNSGADFDWMLELAPDAEYITEEPGSKYDPKKVVIKTDHFPLPPGYDPAKELSPSYPTSLVFVNGQSEILKRVYNRCLEKGCKFIFSTWARQLIRPDNKGRVQGVICQDKKGEYTKMLARKGVILAAGDYAGNREMLAYYTPWALQCMNFGLGMDAAGKPTNTGDGQRMGVWVGAKMEDGPHAWMTHAAGYMGSDAFFLANAEGERFVNEDLGGQWLSNALYRQPGSFGWQIFDDKWPEQIIHMGVGHGSINFAYHMEENSIQGDQMPGEGLMPEGFSLLARELVNADTLEELTAKLGLEATARARLLESIKRYNMLCEKGVDEDFGKAAKRLFPIEHPPFHAARINGGAMLVCLGGLTCDPETGNVQDKEYRRIEGLYAAGNTMGGRFLVDYPLVCSGVSHGMALTQGRLVGTVVAGL